MQIVVPDLGDFSDVEVVEVLVSVGETVSVEDPLIVLETDKATLEVPATHAGVVTALSVKAGDRVSAGDSILELDVADAQVEEEATEPVVAADSADVKADAAPTGVAQHLTLVVPDLGDFANVEVIEVLVNVGATVSAEDPLIMLETDKATMEVPATHGGVITDIKVKAGDHVSAGDEILDLTAEPQAAPVAEPAQAPAAPHAPAAEKSSAQSAVSHAARSAPVDELRFGKAHASPSVRKLARELGVDLGAVTGSGRKGRVTADDLKAFVKRIMQGGAAAGPALPQVPEIDFASFGEVESRPLSRIQKISGPRLHASWVNVPHVTQHDEADITELEAVRQELKPQAKAQGISLTPLAFIMRAVVLALEEFPVFCASLSADGEALVVKKYRHLGFAADTPNGLVVPVVKDADQLDVFGLAKALAELSEKARAGKLGAGEMQGGVFTISSLGGIGGTFFTPIINAPEVAILGVSRSQLRPIYVGGEIVPRLILPLSLSYDHRVIDGATAVRFTTRLTELLGQGRQLLEMSR
ncbi:MAG: dihydrolipoyllysine-residue acetyltransferase [Gammaproteobacteria bacterium]|nr:dihydrolipoyllysine-residue acetyltransferase [Gammaproteobacteria bacterium]MDH3506660.1 dihydrolipoyllysine-residue acetyltransferase [Gammaproteobacteria bacterium]